MRFTLLSLLVSSLLAAAVPAPGPGSANTAIVPRSIGTNTGTASAGKPTPSAGGGSAGKPRKPIPKSRLAKLSVPSGAACPLQSKGSSSSSSSTKTGSKPASTPTSTRRATAPRSLEARKVSEKTIAALIERFWTAAHDQRKLDNKLVRGIAEGIYELSEGEWEPDSSRLAASYFEGLTRLCWLYSNKRGSDGATLYSKLVLYGYNLWVGMDSRAKGSFASDCSHFTNTLQEYQYISAKPKYRYPIIQSAASVTTAMYGQGEVSTAAEQLWDKRYPERCEGGSSSDSSPNRDGKGKKGKKPQA